MGQGDERGGRQGVDRCLWLLLLLWRRRIEENSGCSCQTIWVKMLQLRQSTDGRCGILVVGSLMITLVRTMRRPVNKPPACLCFHKPLTTADGAP